MTKCKTDLTIDCMINHKTEGKGTESPPVDIAIIGAGIAGLSAAVHARQAGFSVGVFEKHSIPGGLCTAWKRKGFTFDYCVDYLVGSDPTVDLYEVWKNLGVIDKVDFLPIENFGQYRDKQGNTLNLYTNPDRLESHLLEISPEDKNSIKILTNIMRRGKKIEITSMNPRGNWGPFLRSIGPGLSIAKWSKQSLQEWCSQLKSPLLKWGIPRIVGGDMDFQLAGPFSFFGMMDRGAIATPLGGSLPIAKAIEERAISLGAQIAYRSEVEEILHSDGTVNGVRLSNGLVQRAGLVISAGDVHHCLSKLLKGKVHSPVYERKFKEAPLYPTMVQVSLGVEVDPQWKLDQCPRKNYFEIPSPIIIGDKKHHYLSCYQYFQDSIISQGNRTSILLKYEEDYEYWTNLKGDPPAYKKEKQRVLEESLNRLEMFFPGISERTLCSDVATPSSCYDYTYNWKGSSQGWKLESMGDALRGSSLPKSFPELKGLYLMGQWTSPGGGLPIMARQGRDLIHGIAKG